MSSVPKVISIRADSALQVEGSKEAHKFVCASFDEGVFLLDYTPAEIGAILTLEFSFADNVDEDKDTGKWYPQMWASDVAEPPLAKKKYTYTSTLIGNEPISLSIPLMDNAVRVQVFETSTAKGNLAIKAVGTSLGQS